MMNHQQEMKVIERDHTFLNYFGSDQLIQLTNLYCKSVDIEYIYEIKVYPNLYCDFYSLLSSNRELTILKSNNFSRDYNNNNNGNNNNHIHHHHYHHYHHHHHHHHSHNHNPQHHQVESLIGSSIFISFLFFLSLLILFIIGRLIYKHNLKKRVSTFLEKHCQRNKEMKTSSSSQISGDFSSAAFPKSLNINQKNKNDDDDSSGADDLSVGGETFDGDSDFEHFKEVQVVGDIDNVFFFNHSNQENLDENLKNKLL
ncbi:hypothetical protein ACTFIU_007565 [Dictyostelium citrinum]